MKHGCRAAMTFLVYCQRFWLTARLPKAVEKSDKKRLIQRSQILWQKGRDSEAPTLHQKEKRERERDFRLIKNASRIPRQGQRFPRPTFF